MKKRELSLVQVRVSKALHRDAKIAAMDAGLTLREWVSGLIREGVKRGAVVAAAAMESGSGEGDGE